MVYAKKLKSESEEHNLTKEVTASVRQIFFNNQLLTNLMVDVEKQVNKFTPDILLKNGNDIIAAFEVVNTNSISLEKVNFFKNNNLTLLAIYINEWYEKYKNYVFTETLKNEFIQYVTDILKGNKNGYLLRTISQQNKQLYIDINGQKIKFVKYENISKIGENKTFVLTAFDDKGNSYKLCLIDGTKRVYKKFLNSIRVNGENIYLIKSYNDCWIDTLSQNPLVKIV